MKPSKRTTGRVVALSSVIAAAMLVPGVANAESEVVIPPPTTVVDCGHPYGDTAEPAECPVSIQGEITVNNRTRKDRVKNVRVIIRDANGARVAKVDIAVEVAARSSVSLDPAEFLDLNTVTDGTHTYVVRNLREDGTLARTISARGTFVVNRAVA